MQNKMTALVKELFEKLNISIDSIEILETEKPNIFNIKIKTEESWIVIWPHGKNLDAIQNILKLMLSKLVGEKIKIHLEINDYIKTKDERLFEFIEKEINYLERSRKKELALPFYSAYERKKIHWYIHQMKEKWIFTKSRWEWKERRLYIFKETAKLTIDIDWDDI